MIVGNEIRWLDLHTTKNDWQEQAHHVAKRNHAPESQDETRFSQYRVSWDDFLQSPNLN